MTLVCVCVIGILSSVRVLPPAQESGTGVELGTMTLVTGLLKFFELSSTL